MRKWPERYRQAELVLMDDGRLEEIRDEAATKFNDVVDTYRDGDEAAYYERLVGATSDILLERDSEGSAR